MLSMLDFLTETTKKVIYKTWYLATTAEAIQVIAVCYNVCCNLAIQTLLDLSAAFDSVDNHTLLQRLWKSYGLDGKIIDW